MQSTIKTIKKICKEMYQECLETIIEKRLKQTDYFDKIMFEQSIIEYIIKQLYINVFHKENKPSGRIKNCDNSSVIKLNGELYLEPSGIYFSYFEKLNLFLLIMNDNENFIRAGKFIFNKMVSDHEEEVCNIQITEPVTYKYLNLKYFNEIDFNENGKLSNFEEDAIYLEEIVKILYGDNKKSDDIIKAIINFINEVRGLLKCKISDLANIDIYKFNSILFEHTLLSQSESIHLTDDEKEIIKYNILNSKHSNKILKLIYTFLYTRSILTDNEEYDYYDLTFITVSIFKIVEVLFADFLNSRFPNKIINDINGNKIELGKDSITLGAMYQIFECNDEEINNFLKTKNKYSDRVKEIFSKWIQNSRNGFLHKHIIEVTNIEQMNKSIDDSIKLICLLILMFDK